jgi:alpha-beta hydrolase superfamily lysophospholipase
MKTFESSWQSKGQVRLYIRGWEPDKKAKAVVALVHGLGEHTGRYAHVGEALTKAGYALVGFDLRGHGRSGGPRGDIPDYESLMNDIADFLGRLRVRYPKLPLFLYGHSLGGNQVLNFGLRRRPKIQGVIATAPWLRLASKPSAAKMALARIMNSIAPGLPQKSGLETAAISHDPEIVRLYDRDPLVHDRISARLFTSAYDAGLWALDHAADFPLPLLLMHGTADRLTSAEASHEFARRAGKRATWHAWAGCYHEIHNEPGKARVFKVMIAWMDGKLKK